MFQRTIRMIECGMKPIYVFDGKPPVLKSEELSRRKKTKEEASESLKEATEVGNQEEAAKLTKRTVKVTQQHNDDCKKLLQLMGVPVIEAPSEAEAQCAAMCRAGLVWATGTEDMDALTFGTPILLRHLTFSEARKIPIAEYHLDKVLEGLGLTMDEFIDLCILCGCDYADSIRGIGPKRAYELIKKYHCLEEVLKNLDKTKYPIPENFPIEEVRALFKNPEVLPDLSSLDFSFKDPDEEGLVKFLCGEKNFNEDRVRKAVQKLRKSKSTSVQGRLDAYFKPAPTPSPAPVPPSSSQIKRKPEKQAKKKGPATKKKAPPGKKK